MFKIKSTKAVKFALTLKKIMPQKVTKEFFTNYKKYLKLKVESQRTSKFNYYFSG